MSDIDRVFARFPDEKSPTVERHEQRSIPKRGTHGTQRSRIVEVEHVRSGSTNRAAEQHRPAPSFGVRAASWQDGFPARDAPPAFLDAPKPAVAAPVAPTFHVMPARSPSVPAAEAVPAGPDPEPAVAARHGRWRPRRQTAPAAPARRIADPFDASDDRANCIRCGYAMEPTRGTHGQTTCSECG
jgi:hypothetical protein